ncbi:MAG: hypothetical protein GX295_03025 [Syntrophomonadaceae bacterium]|nr:hypothetical protein [Syntrophomonadaceae bacterium]
MNKSGPEEFLSQVLPILTDPQAFEAFLNQAPFTGLEKESLRQIYQQITNPRMTSNNQNSLNQVLQSLLQRINPDQLENLIPLIEQIQNTPPEKLIKLIQLLRN